jgi:hypothetical protein
MTTRITAIGHAIQAVNHNTKPRANSTAPAAINRHGFTRPVSQSGLVDRALSTKRPRRRERPTDRACPSARERAQRPTDRLTVVGIPNVTRPCAFVFLRSAGRILVSEMINAGWLE